jgi:hypothetical protein
MRRALPWLLGARRQGQARQRQRQGQGQGQYLQRQLPRGFFSRASGEGEGEKLSDARDWFGAPGSPMTEKIIAVEEERIESTFGRSERTRLEGVLQCLCLLVIMHASSLRMVVHLSIAYIT